MANDINEVIAEHPIEGTPAIIRYKYRTSKTSFRTPATLDSSVSECVVMPSHDGTVRFERHTIDIFRNGEIPRVSGWWADIERNVVKPITQKRIAEQHARLRETAVKLVEARVAQVRTLDPAKVREQAR